MDNRRHTAGRECLIERVPNLLSCFRIALSIALLFLRDKPILLAVVYSICGISDVADGYLARLLNAETTLGMKLDSLGDFIFHAVWLIILFNLALNENGALIFFCVITIAIIRAINLVITKIKFKQWGIMHTIGNKLTGCVLFLMLPVCVFTGGILPWSIIAVGTIAVLSALEENVILLKSKNYDANRRSVLTRQTRGLSLPVGRFTLKDEQFFLR